MSSDTAPPSSSDPSGTSDPGPDLAAAPHRPAGAPGDNTTMLEVLHDYEEAGYAGQFSVVDDGLVLCYTCRSRTEPESLAVTSMRRLEGASDPSDMLMVAAITCPICATGGVLIMNYGPEASAEQAQVQAALNDRRGTGPLPANRAPEEGEDGA
ncbi:MAG: hypothetical protein R2761_18850 [Acidimicrobiales bacterium]